MQKIKDKQHQYLDMETLLELSMEGLTPIVFLKKAALERGNKFCEFSPIGRINFRKLFITRFRSLAAKIWALSGERRLIPLGNNYFVLKLD